ncbi:MAG: hypothetical protein VX546_08880 [Myxococcota bacterium]|nr:hypothetical protein [Myxococcota bacterium]
MSLVFVAGPAALADGLGGGLERGDRAYAARGVDNDGRGRAAPDRIAVAIEAYEEALAEDPGNLVARWKAMAALYFAGDFAAPDVEAAHAFFERGRLLGEDGIARVARRLDLGRPLVDLDAEVIRASVPRALATPVGRLYFWAAINWGAWTREEGFLQIVRQGVARRLRDYAKVSLALDPAIYRGGSQRLLAHMHANLPRVPFISGWVDRELAVGFADQALIVAPDDVGNRAILGLVLLDTVPARRAEALSILAEVAEAAPREHLVVEDQATREMARRRLAEERAD